MSRAPRMRWRSEIRFPYLNETIVRLITLLVLWVTGATIQVSVAADAQLAWDAVSDSRLAYYEVLQRTASQTYVSKVTTTGTTAAVTGLSAGQTYYFAARACDQTGTACSTLSNEVSTTIPGTPPPLSITTASLPNGTAGAAYSVTLAATGGTGPYSWSIASGSLPSGLTLNSATGTISGTPRAVATSNLHGSGDRFGESCGNDQQGTEHRGRRRPDHAASPLHHHGVIAQRHGRRSLLRDLGGDRRHRALQLVHCKRLPAQRPDLELRHWDHQRDAHGGGDFQLHGSGDRFGESCGNEQQGTEHCRRRHPDDRHHLAEYRGAGFGGRRCG